MTNYASMTVAVLRQKLSALGLSTSGLKKDLVIRLEEAEKNMEEVAEDKKNIEQKAQEETGVEEPVPVVSAKGKDKGGRETPSSTGSRSGSGTVSANGRRSSGRIPRDRPKSLEVVLEEAPRRTGSLRRAGSKSSKSGMEVNDESPGSALVSPTTPTIVSPVTADTGEPATTTQGGQRQSQLQDESDAPAEAEEDSAQASLPTQPTSSSRHSASAKLPPSTAPTPTTPSAPLHFPSSPAPGPPSPVIAEPPTPHPELSLRVGAESSIAASSDTGDMEFEVDTSRHPKTPNSGRRVTSSSVPSAPPTEPVSPATSTATSSHYPASVSNLSARATAGSMTTAAPSVIGEEIEDGIPGSATTGNASLLTMHSPVPAVVQSVSVVPVVEVSPEPNGRIPPPSASASTATTATVKPSITIRGRASMGGGAQAPPVTRHAASALPSPTSATALASSTVASHSTVSETPRLPAPISSDPPSITSPYQTHADTTTYEAPKSPPTVPFDDDTLNSVVVRGFVRPLQLPAVQQLLAGYGQVTRFWMNGIKTHCYVTYASPASAAVAAVALEGFKFPTDRTDNKVLTATTISAAECVSNISQDAGKEKKPAPFVARAAPVAGPTGRNVVGAGGIGIAGRAAVLGGRQTASAQVPTMASGSDSVPPAVSGSITPTETEAKQGFRPAGVPANEPPGAEVVALDDQNRGLEGAQSNHPIQIRGRGAAGPQRVFGIVGMGKVLRDQIHKAVVSEPVRPLLSPFPDLAPPPQPALDRLFRKTKAEPAIYWLPISDEEVKEREKSNWNPDVTDDLGSPRTKEWTVEQKEIRQKEYEARQREKAAREAAIAREREEMEKERMRKNMEREAREKVCGGYMGKAIGFPFYIYVQFNTSPHQLQNIDRFIGSGRRPPGPQAPGRQPGRTVSPPRGGARGGRSPSGSRSRSPQPRKAKRRPSRSPSPSNRSRSRSPPRGKKLKVDEGKAENSDGKRKVRSPSRSVSRSPPRKKAGNGDRDRERDRDDSRIGDSKKSDRDTRRR
ncbi:hypothetical protein HDU93_009083 [Gonapodya sp. JEL0774]|nr:hypothetical protein HDU93_009083 [Gonapodya sp. JEL0774]